MHHVLPHARRVAAHIVGGGLLGLFLAIEVALAGRRLGFRHRITVYEGGALGGGLRHAAAPRCQLWLHREGVLWALSQPAVSLGLQRSTPRLVALAPNAIRQPPAFAVALRADEESAHAEDAFRSLGISFERVPAGLFRTWLPELRLPSDAIIYRTRDATVDLRVAAMELRSHAAKLGVRCVPRSIVRFDTRAGRVSSLHHMGGGHTLVARDDIVALTCGPGIRPLLARAGVAIPDLRHFLCTLIAADVGVPALVAFLRGGVNVVPHPTADGRTVNVFGDARRIELPPDADGKTFSAPRQAVADLRRDVEEKLGVVIPASANHWTGIKAEIVPTTAARSQAHHVLRVPGIDNAWAALPGKMSQAAETARVLVARMLSDSFGSGLARPIWEHETTTKASKRFA